MSIAVEFLPNIEVKQVSIYAESCQYLMWSVYGPWFCQYLEDNQVTRMEFYSFISLISSFADQEL